MIQGINKMTMELERVDATEWRDQHLGTRPRPGNLETFSNGRVRDRDFWIFKIGARPGRDRESPAFSLETETRPGRDLNKIPRFGTRPRRDCSKYLELDESETETAWDSKYGASPLVRSVTVLSDHQTLLPTSYLSEHHLRSGV